MMSYFFLTAILCFSLTLPLSAAKRALLIGVNDYIQGPAEWDLRGCENDVVMTRELLAGKFGFPPENIKVLLDEEATARNILQAIEEWLAVPGKPDDIAYFHFSGHGSQTADQDGDEDDGADELICPADMRQGWIETVITDDQLRNALARIPTRNLTVVLDACHSGSGTRDLSLSRPRFVEFEPGLSGKTRGLAMPPAAPARDKLAGSGGIEGDGKAQVTISGCRPDQTSADAWIREGFYAGALTYHLVENMKKAPPEITYRALLEQVARDLQGANYTQVPQLDGAGDQPLFGGGAAEETSVSFAVVESVEGRQIRLSRAPLATPGSIWAIFPPGETAFEGRGVGQVEILRADQAVAEALLREEAPIQPGCRAREILRGFKVEPLRLRLEAQDEGLAAPVREALARLDFVEVVGEGQRFDHRVQVRVDSGGLEAVLTLDGAAGAPVQGADAAQLAEALRPQLENAHAFKFLAALDNPAPPFAVEIWGHRAGSQEALDQAPAEKLVQTRIGEVLRFNFRAAKPCYLTLIDLGTSGRITVLFPNQYRPDGAVEGGKIYQTGTRGEMPFQLRASGPAGRELVKVIATLDSLDLSSLQLGEAGGGGTRIIPSGSHFVRQLVRDLAPLEMESAVMFLPTERWATDYLIVETAP